MTHISSSLFILTVQLKQLHESIRFSPKRHSNLFSSQLCTWIPDVLVFWHSPKPESERWAGRPQLSFLVPCCFWRIRGRHHPVWLLDRSHLPLPMDSFFLVTCVNLHHFTAGSLSHDEDQFTVSGFTGLIDHLTTSTCDRTINNDAN